MFTIPSRLRPAALPVLLSVLAACGGPEPEPSRPPAPAPAPAAPARPADRPPAEPRLQNIRPLTPGGAKNGEGYFSPDGRSIVFQGIPDGSWYYRIFTLDAGGGDPRPVSPLPAKTTCAFFHPGGNRLIFASTHHQPRSAGEPPPQGRGYQWDFDPAFDIFQCNPDGSNLKQLTDAPGYDAEGSYSPDGRDIVFTSNRDGDLEIYVMAADGGNPTRLTDSPGYDGGPFFSPNGKSIVFRRFTPDGRSARIMVIHIWSTDPGNAEPQPAPHPWVRTTTQTLTRFPAVSWCPFFHPDGRRIVFSTTVGDHRNFELFMVDMDGANLTRLTRSDGFDGLPAFSPDGRRLLWTSTRWDGKSELTCADFVDPPAPPSDPEITAADARRHVEALASEDADGRRAGTLGGEIGSSYVAGVFKRLGLRPGGDDGTYFQWFDLTWGILPGPGNALAVRIGEQALETQPGDFRPLPFSPSAAVEADAVAVGYGLALPEGGEDDYAGWDVKGRVAVALDDGPAGWRDRHPGQASRLTVRRKAATAAEKGAAALLVVSEIGPAPPAHGGLELAEAPIPVARVSRAFWDRVLKAAGGRPAPIEVSLRVDMVRERRETCNVIGILPGAGPEAVILGAHHDHLGRGIPGYSLAPEAEGVHFGADDNASGVAGLLEAAEAFAGRKEPLPRSLVFIAFGAEELGLLGAADYLDHPAIPLDRTVAMVNLDMIGRAGTAGNHGVSIQGVGTSPLWKNFVDSLEGRTPLQRALRQDGFGPSDHNLFCARKIPVLFFFTGLHDDYHKPSDTADKLDYGGLAEVAKLAARAVETAASAPERPSFVEVQGMPEAPRGGFRVYLGTIPDYVAEVTGVKLSGVRPGSPAEKAGLQAGDIIIRFGRSPIRNIYDYTYALQDCEPDRPIDLAVQRDGAVVERKVTPGRRPE